VRFTPTEDIRVPGPYVWVRLGAAEQIYWRMMDNGQECGLARSHGQQDGFEFVDKGRGFSFSPESGDRKLVDTRPEYVVDGVSRPVGSCTHGWISDPKTALPQSLTLDLPKQAAVKEVRLTFDSDFNRQHPEPHPPTLARAYRVEGRTETGAWTLLAECDDNLQRHRIHEISPQVLESVRVTVLSTWGDPSARIFEVRLY